MQRTRLNQIVDRGLNQIELWLQNPWRLTSLYLIGFLAGFLFAAIVSTASGAQSNQDVIASLICVLVVEWLSRSYYSQPESKRLAVFHILNWFKLGLVYGLFLDAFKLGS
jgi:Protein of unknown function (DUF565)